MTLFIAHVGAQEQDHRGVFGRPQALLPTREPNMHSTIISYPIY